MNALSLRAFTTFVRDDENGQDLLEYAMLVALIVLVAIGAVGTLGNTITTLFWNVIAVATTAI